MLPYASFFHHAVLKLSGDIGMQRLPRFTWLIVAACPTLLGAQGFNVFGQNTCTMGRAGTAAGGPRAEGVASLINPAGLAGSNGGHTTPGSALGKMGGGVTGRRI